MKGYGEYYRNAKEDQEEIAASQSSENPYKVLEDKVIDLMTYATENDISLSELKKIIEKVI